MRLIEIAKSCSWGLHLRVLGIGLPFPRIQTKVSRLWKRRFTSLSKEELTTLISAQFHDILGKEINWHEPKTFNDKLNWLKVNYHNPLMTVCADKVKARDFFLSKYPGREDLLVRQLGVYNRFEDIDIDSFPADAFVLKSNWGSGAQLIVNNKSAFNRSAARKVANKWMAIRSNHYYDFFEWGYKNIEPKIVVESFLTFKYKLEFFCFNGEPRFFWIVLNDKTKNTKANFYNLDWTRIPLANHYPNFEESVDRPEKYEEMLEMARGLSAGFPFVRCDFYVTEHGFRFSEMTFYHWAGYCEFTPENYDSLWGDMLTLPEKGND